MSNVVGFLPENIPRILINRDIVQVRKSSTQDSQDGFCIWDACLLGNCDAVTQAMKDKLSKTDSAATTSAEHKPHSGRLIATDDNGNGLWLKKQPRESILLFEGALLSATNEKDEVAPPQNVMVVHCDNCENEIKGNIFCCKTCFDYDLCGSCYPKIRQQHAGGQHEFEIQTNNII